jgi:hypothetical protein
MYFNKPTNILPSPLQIQPMLQFSLKVIEPEPKLLRKLVSKTLFQL